MKTILLTSALVALACALNALPSDTPQEFLSRMDRGAAAFQSLTANVHYVTHTAVIDDNTEESGSLKMKKIRANEVQGRIDFTQPDPRTVTFEQRSVEIYFPKTKILQIYDLGSKGEQLDRFLMLGFGTSGSELARDYDVQVEGTEALSNTQFTKLELRPKAADVRKQVTRIELWVPEHGAPYPVQEKIYEPSGDSRLITYSSMAINPSLTADAMKLKLPPGVKKEYPQK
jgi:outer membrane lipoprotein-sorting protein